MPSKWPIFFLPGHLYGYACVSPNTSASLTPTRGNHARVGGRGHVLRRHGGSFEWDVEAFIAERVAIEGTKDNFVMGKGIEASYELLHTSAASLAPTQVRILRCSCDGALHMCLFALPLRASLSLFCTLMSLNTLWLECLHG